jgi:hypothetical protein
MLFASQQIISAPRGTAWLFRICTYPVIKHHDAKTNGDPKGRKRRTVIRKAVPVQYGNR